MICSIIIVVVIIIVIIIIIIIIIINISSILVVKWTHNKKLKSRCKKYALHTKQSFFVHNDSYLDANNYDNNWICS